MWSTKLAILSSGLLATYLSYYLYKQYQNYKFLFNLSLQKEECDEAKINNNHIIIPYKHNHNNYKVILPYDRSMLFTMSNYLVKSVKNNQEEDITQQPGIPYLITSEDLDCDKIIVVDLNQEVERVFYKTPPCYGE